MRRARTPSRPVTSRRSAPPRAHAGRDDHPEACPRGGCRRWTGRGCGTTGNADRGARSHDRRRNRVRTTRHGVRGCRDSLPGLKANLPETSAGSREHGCPRNPTAHHCRLTSPSGFSIRWIPKRASPPATGARPSSLTYPPRLGGNSDPRRTFMGVHVGGANAPAPTWPAWSPIGERRGLHHRARPPVRRRGPHKGERPGTKPACQEAGGARAVPRRTDHQDPPGLRRTRPAAGVHGDRRQRQRPHPPGRRGRGHPDRAHRPGPPAGAARAPDRRQGLLHRHHPRLSEAAAHPAHHPPNAPIGLPRGPGAGTAAAGSTATATGAAT